MEALAIMVLEHRIILDKTWRRSDHWALLELGELATLVASGAESTRLSSQIVR